jgi:hypothetical protein
VSKAEVMVARISQSCHHERSEGSAFRDGTKAAAIFLLCSLSRPNVQLR